MPVQIKGVGSIDGLDQGLDVGIITATSFVGTGVSVVGVITATSFSGSGANLTGITQTTINNNGSNRIITGSGTANTLEGEATFIYDGTSVATIDTSQTYATFRLDGNSGGAIEFYENGTRRFEIYGIDAEVALYDRDKGAYHTRFKSGGNIELSDGKLLIGTTTAGATGANYLTLAATGSAGLTIRSGTSNDGNIFFSDATSGTGEYAGYVQYEHANNALRFGTASTERFRLGTNSNSGIVGSFGTGSSHLNNSTTGDRASFKVGGLLHLEGAFGNNAMTGLYYNCYSGGNDLFYGGTYTPSGGDRRASAITMRYGGVAVMVDNSSTAYSPTNQITTMQTALNISREGTVTKPYQYVFTVSTNGSSGFSKAANWEKITGLTPYTSQCTGVSDGTNWSNSTQRFTAPVTGVYHFFVGGWATSASNGVRYGYTFKHTNGNNYAFIGGGNYCLTDSPMDGYSRTIKLSAGEWVELWGFSAVSTTWSKWARDLFLGPLP